MDRPWNILYHLTLVGASTYGLMSMSLRSKRFALAALVLYYANGWFGLLDESISTHFPVVFIVCLQLHISARFSEKALVRRLLKAQVDREVVQEKQKHINHVICTNAEPCYEKNFVIPENEAITKADYFAYKIAAISGVNLFAAEVCISSDVDTVLPYLLLVPSALDLFMNYVVRIRWNSITKVTQIFSVSLLYNFAFRDKRPILFVPGTAFLFAMLSPIFVDIPGYNTVAVFFTVWFLEGKDFEDFGF